MNHNPESRGAVRRLVFITLSLVLLVIIFQVGFVAGKINAKQDQILSSEQSKSKVIEKILGINKETPESEARDVDFQLFWDVWDTLKQKYVKKDSLKEQDLFYGAIKGMVAAAGDPYTVFLDPKESKVFADDLAGTFEGIGAEIGIKKERLLIIAPLPDSPAQKAGLRAGDRILAINGTTTLGMSVDEAVNKIRGPKDTLVTLTVNHSGDDKVTEIKITRGVIIIKSVKTAMGKNGIYTITVTSFNDDTEPLFNQAVDDIVAKKPKGIILDLRNNPGGYLNAAVSLAGNWLDKGKVVVSEKFGDGKSDEYPAAGLSRLKGIPTVILVNQGSASASEIVSGALQDYGVAKLVGKQTFGKGSVQVLDKLKDGSSLKVTIAQWMTPKGNNISEKGITPDVVIDLKSEDYENNKDPQMDKAVELLTKPQAK
jgi:carboxyl-terminal processing protease